MVAQVSPGVSVAQHLSDALTQHNARVQPEGTGPVGAVIGLTASDAPELVERLPRSLLLAPGLGAQGGSFDQLASRFASAKQRVLPSSSRGVLAAGPDERALATAIAEHCRAANAALQ